MNGRQKPIRNQMKNEPPLIFPIAPADRPKKKQMTSSSTAAQPLAPLRGLAAPR